MNKFIIALVLSGSLLLQQAAYACTTWAVAGPSAADNGTIVAKNRDEIPNHITDIRLITPSAGYRYLSMNAQDAPQPDCKGGINEKGFIVFTQSPPTAELENYRGKLTGHHGNNWLLSHYSTVKEALAALQRGEWTANPEFIVLGDAHEVAYIEMGLDGKYAINSTRNGTLVHANHYLEPALIDTNPDQIGKSTLRRQQKAQNQLSSKENFTFEDIINFTQDPVVWRVNPPMHVRTLGSMVVNSTPNGDVTIWVKLANPGLEVHETKFTLKEALEGKVPLPFS
ncbi:MAG: C45 family peptidase [Pelosinus sp.]|nr:C45 family peptidase [Pelosinus sp.]